MLILLDSYRRAISPMEQSPESLIERPELSGACPAISVEELARWVREASKRVVEFMAGLTDPQLMGPRLAIVNPLLWEVGHVAWFQEKWVLRHTGGRDPIHAGADDLYDSAAVPHAARWDLPLPCREETVHYLCEVRDRVIAGLERGELGAGAAYFVALSVFHADMHTEAFTYTRQVLGYPPPRLNLLSASPPAAEGPIDGDSRMPGGAFLLGASRSEPFVFDNEKWEHTVHVRPFAISRRAVTQAEFAEFVGDGGYCRPKLWSHDGWAWRTAENAEHPVYWRRLSAGAWQRRIFDHWVPLEPHLPMVHVNWFEAEAYGNWKRRRLPTEAEWEMAAAADSAANERGGAERKRRYPWGDEPPWPGVANLDWQAMGTLDVGALSAGDSPQGCRQMIGNVWEWTANDFLPYPGFVPDPYKEYSQPWFGTHRVLRGGCWATRGRLLRNTWRNFFLPQRRDVFAGFRTCALD